MTTLADRIIEQASNEAEALLPLLFTSFFMLFICLMFCLTIYLWVIDHKKTKKEHNFFRWLTKHLIG